MTPAECQDLVWAEVVNHAVDELAWGMAAGYVTIGGELIRPAACASHFQRVGDAIAAAQWLMGRVAERLCEHLGTSYEALRVEVKSRVRLLIPTMAADLKRSEAKRAMWEAKKASDAAAQAAIPAEERTGRRLGQDLHGYRSGRLLVVRRGGLVGTHRLWWCLCDCGKEKALLAQALKAGRVKSCGCLLAELRSHKKPKTQAA